MFTLKAWTFILAASITGLSASVLSAQSRTELPTREEIAEYRLRNASLSLVATASRIELMVVDGPAAMVIYLDDVSVRRWLANNAWLLALNPRTRPDTAFEFSSVILRHSDASYGSGLILTRSFRNRGPSAYLTTWVGRTRHTAIPLSKGQTHSLALALGRAAEVSRRMKLAPRE